MPQSVTQKFLILKYSPRGEQGASFSVPNCIMRGACVFTWGRAFNPGVRNKQTVKIYKVSFSPSVLQSLSIRNTR